MSGHFRHLSLQCPFQQKIHFFLNLDWNLPFDNRFSPVEFGKIVAAGGGVLEVYGGFGGSSGL